MSDSNSAIKKWGIAAIAVLLALEFAVFPWLDWLDDVHRQRQSASEFVAKQEQTLASATQVAEKEQQLEQLEKLIGNLPQVGEKDDPALLWLKVVDAAVEKTGVKVNNKSPSRSVPINDDFAAYTGRINVNGDYSHVLSLLDELENIEAGNRVRQVSFFQRKATLGKVTANIEFIRVYKTP
ncbi:hypothetical protein CWC05_13765 [Pseudoalteromonas ruthenica]|uniref:Uncharacterized protein n=1 Tax=Pseudoalteromonas ruthenica TaxID=151081 RepID=A0A5S3Z2H1_9GAMM|nr:MULTISPECIES: hypothetical protein [Pseudoalteromonas]MCG7543698.1 hypothetical protein [Pseudoalteromonas sp. MM17-2]TMO46488.1 hypothetical protein CWC24_10330 [Pseudoalteromonas ruthenica]TMO50341.1 hypothetical protein CWC23_11455 [Pseudoalteromonas ruthenica]TMP86469.1 hypothetical protein CWC05_13765 [Pseudoalteromonas ruthenica]|tara:strand:+ start:272 stop:814 length:543 start_codon:yes stop_codon:yes gene_type:complete